MVVSWTPVSATSVERAASQPVSSTRFPTATDISGVACVHGDVRGFLIPEVWTLEHPRLRVELSKVQGASSHPQRRKPPSRVACRMLAGGFCLSFFFLWIEGCWDRGSGGGRHHGEGLEEYSWQHVRVPAAAVAGSAQCATVFVFPCRNGIGWFERERITDVGVCLPRHSKSAIASNPDANKQRRPANSAIPVFVNVVEYIKDQTTSKVTSSKEAKGNIWDKTYCGQCPLACLSSLPIKINLVSVLF